MIDTGKQKITNTLTSVPEFSSLRMRLSWPFQPWSEDKMQFNFFLFSFINKDPNKCILLESTTVQNINYCYIQ